MVIFDRVAKTLLPADGSGVAVETDDRWRVDSRVANASDDVVVWGRPPLASGAGVGAARRFAGHRRRALSRLRRRPPAGLRVVDAVWWTPPEIKRSRLKQPLKDALGAGVLISLSRSDRYERSLDEAWRDAGFEGRAPAPQPSSGGSLRIEPEDVGEPQIFRAGPVETPADARLVAGVLELLEAAGVSHVPRALSSGRAAGTGWLIESRLEGRRPARLTNELVRAAVALCAGLPRKPSPPAAFEEDFATVLKHLPDISERLEHVVGPHREVIAAMPSTLRHGDLWAGNLLERNGRLTGVVDWDAWHRSGVPGSDLVQLLGAEGSGRNLGERYGRRPWRHDDFVAATAAYWTRIGLTPTAEVLDASGAAWWVGQIAANLERLPHLATNPVWMKANVHAVLESD